jgi:hypothetical protein
MKYLPPSGSSSRDRPRSSAGRTRTLFAGQRAVRQVTSFRAIDAVQAGDVA